MARPLLILESQKHSMQSFGIQQQLVPQALPSPPLEYKPKTKEKGKEAAPNDKGKEAAKQKDSPQQDKGKAKAAAAAAPAKLRQ